MASHNASERLYALGPGVTAAVSFGICDTLAKMIFADGVDPLTLAVIRGIVGVGIMFVYLRLGSPPVPATPRARGFALGLGVLFAVIVYALFKAIALITVPLAILTYFIYPLLTGLGGAIFGVERLRWQGVLAALVAFCGLALMIGADPQHLSFAGVGFAAGAALCRATFLLVARTELQNTDPRLTTWHSLLSSTAVLAVAAAATMNWNGPQTSYGWTLVVLLSIGVAVATLTLYVSTVRIGPFRSALIMNLEPLLVTVLSAILLGEIVTPIQGLGAAIMLGALVAFQLRR
jgi:drug/metabolite transporter (DMT)-like permease